MNITIHVKVTRRVRNRQGFVLKVGTKHTEKLWFPSKKLAIAAAKAIAFDLAMSIQSVERPNRTTCTSLLR